MDETVKLFKEIANYAMEELGDAEKYIKKAIALKAEKPDLAQLFHKLSSEELGHYQLEMAEMKRMANPVNGREDLRIACEFLCEHAMDWEKSIKVMHEMFRE